MKYQHGELTPSHYSGGKYHATVYGFYQVDGVRQEWARTDCPQCGLEDWEFALEWYGGICGWCHSLMFVGMEDIPL